MKKSFKRCISIFMMIVMTVLVLHLDGFGTVADKAIAETADGLAYIAMVGDMNEENDSEINYWSSGEYYHNNTVQKPVEFKYGETFEVSITTSAPLYNIWYMSPVLIPYGEVPDDDDQDSLKYEVELFIDGVLTEIDYTNNSGFTWANEETGEYIDGQSIRLYCGYNEWNSNYFSFNKSLAVGAKKFTYRICVTNDGSEPKLVRRDPSAAGLAYIAMTSNDWESVYMSPNKDYHSNTVQEPVEFKYGETFEISITTSEPLNGLSTMWPVLVPYGEVPDDDDQDSLKYALELYIDGALTEIDYSNPQGTYWTNEGIGEYTYEESLWLYSGLNEWNSKFFSFDNSLAIGAQEFTYRICVTNDGTEPVLAESDSYVTANNSYKNTWSGTVSPTGEITLSAVVHDENLEGITYEWFKNYDTDRVKITGSGSEITLNAASDDFYSSIVCVVTDRDSEKHEAYYKIRIDNKLKVTGDASNEALVFVTPGTKTKLVAEVSAEDLNGLVYSWTRYYDSIYAGGYYNYMFDSSALLSDTGAEITTGTIGEAEKYVCTISDKYGNEVQATFIVIPDNKFSAYAKTQNVSVKVGKKANLSVVVDACDKTGITYEWVRNYNYYDDGTGSGYQSSQNLNKNTATITTPAIKGKESYRCTVTDNYGNEEYVWFYVNVDNGFSFDCNCEYEYINGNYVIYLKPGESKKISVDYSMIDNTGIKIYKDWELTQEKDISFNVVAKENYTRYYDYFIKDKYNNVYYLNFLILVDNGLDVKVDGYNSNKASVTVNPGDSLNMSLTVNATDKKKLSYEWYCYDQCYYSDVWRNVIVDKYGATTNKNTISIPSVTKTATYECYVTDKYQNLKKALIDVKVENHLTLSANDTVTVDSGEKATLSATVNADDTEGLRYYWYDEMSRVISENSEFTTGQVNAGNQYRLRVYDKYDNYVEHIFNIAVNNGKKVSEVGIKGWDNVKDGCVYAYPGEESGLSADITPYDAGNIGTSWIVDDKSIAGIYNNYIDYLWSGRILLKPLKVGETTITLTADDGNVSDTAKLIVEFKDVNTNYGTTKKAYYYDPVYWAADKGITNGYKNDDGYCSTFGPQKNCTREDMLVFLYRLFGNKYKSKSKNPFKDLEKGKYYYNAVMWAYDKGITKGYSDGTFGVGKSVNRADAMTFIWRAAGSPKAKKASSFTDLKKNYYKEAIAWAAENGIANGYSDGTYGVDKDCLREHIVTFLYRYAKKYNKL